METGLERGIAAFNHREFFACHDILEDVWLEELGPRKQFLQSIIHFAVAFYHEGRENPPGAVRQLRKALAKLAPYLPCYEDVDTARLYDEGLRSLAAMEQGRKLDAYPFIHLVPDFETEAA